MSVNLSSLAGAGWQFFTNDGVPLSGGKLFTYAAGTTTPLPTYTTSLGSIANSNPIILDSDGRTPNEIWLTSGSTYKFVLTDASNNLIGTYDDLPGINDTTGTNAALNTFIADLANTSNSAKGDALVGFRQSNATGILTNAVGRTVHQKLQEIVSVKDFGAVGDDVTDDATAFQNALNTLVANGGGALYVPAGVYRIKSQLTVICNAQQHITIYGEGRYQSTLDFSTANTLGIYFHSTSTSPNQLPAFEVRQIGLITSHDNCGIALDFEYDSSLNIDASVTVSDVLIAQNVDRISDSGSGYGYWSTGIQMKDARNSEITNLHAYGEMNKTPNSQFGINLTGETTAFVFTDSLLLEWTTGLNAVGTSEGVYLNNTDIVYCRYGAQHRFSTGAEPQFTAVGCSFNCANVGVWLENSQQSVIADSLFYAASVLDTGTWPTYTAILINGANSRFNKVTGCTFSKENQRTGDTTTGIDFNVGSHYSASGNHFFGFNGNLFTFGIQTRNGVDSVFVGDDNVFQYVSSPVIFDAGSTKNYRQPIIQSGQFSAVSGATVNFPKAFTSVESVVITHNGINTLLIATVSNVSNTGFTFNCNTAGSIPMYYVATGY